MSAPAQKPAPAPAPTSRSREAPQGDEEAAAELKLGEFQDVDALTHSEAALVISALMTKRRIDNPKKAPETPMLIKTMDYLEHFARFKRKENVEAVERLLSAHKELAKFERAQLGILFPFSLSSRSAYHDIPKIYIYSLQFQRTGSLCCDTAEEAKTLIPSLTDKISDDDLQELLDEITKLMGYAD
ncbi:hypothetical protein B7494_g4291 [Chlorociboria aeruginascens]|nr:hypothetical protein B7494_g4291 [Chlorociboria aeruginascens]